MYDYGYRSLTVIQQQIKLAIHHATTGNNNTSPASVLLSPVFNIEVFSRDTADRVYVSDLIEPVRITIALHSYLTSIIADSLECVTLDKVKGSWSTDGVVMKSFDNNSVVCETIHLSAFAVRKTFLSRAFTPEEAIDIDSLLGSLPKRSVDLKNVTSPIAGSKSRPVKEYLQSILRS